MSFGTTGFGGFGSTNTNNQQSSGFGGFGSTGNTTTGFGTGNASSNAFGANNNTNSSGGLFGGTSGGFGGGASGGFGSSNTNTAFGASKPTFGTANAASGGLFGASSSNTATTSTTAPSSGFGGFGSTPATSTASPFGATGGSLFGGTKPAFGAATNNNSTGSSSLFGGNTSGGFGGIGGFGASNNPGIGANLGDPPGTAITPFQAHKETEGTAGQANSFQNILFQEPYKKWSADELRLADYAQGRRHGNASGAGAFGVSNFGNTGFGSTNQQPSSGFGTGTSTGGGLFGSGANNNTTTSTTGFGTGPSGGFGSTGGGLFGNQSKPASGGLFGSGTTTTTQPAQSTGLFGAASGGGFATSNTTTGFGSNSTPAAGGLFGSNNAPANQNKPTGFSFGNTGGNSGGFGNANANNAFGSANTNSNTGAPGGLFGNSQSAGTGLFGNSTQAQPQQQGTGSVFGGAGGGGGGGGSGFGAQGQQQSAPSLFGNQQKPAGGGLFGGGAAASTTGGGLFGSKPAAPGGGLFGSNTAGQVTNTGGGSGLFGALGANNQTQQAGQSSMFLSAGQNQSKPGLFGNSQPSGAGLFGGQNPQQQNSLFGNHTQQQSQGSILGGSILGTSQGVNAGNLSLTANINDVSAFGSPSLFSNLAGADTPNPGPLATPLSSKTKPRRSSILPMYKLNPASAARFVTPQKRGFGFTYSTYGTPGGSPASAASTPGGVSRSLLGSSNLNRSLSKSVSTSNLRRSFNAEDSILAPGAFSASSGPRYYGNNGSVKKLVINKDMRSDLFSTPTKDKFPADQPHGSRKLSKRVSFDTSTVDAPEIDEGDIITAPTSRGVIVGQEAISATNNVNGYNSTSATLNDAEPGKGKELAIVHEEDSNSQALEDAHEKFDRIPGSYWMSPTKEAIAGMNRMQRQQVGNFTVGRDNVGSVKFQVPVDLTNIDLDEIYGGIVILETRSATVYPIAAKKPPVGKGLNIPALITLEQSWPRGRDKRPSNDAKKFAKHVERLKRIEDTTFDSYDADTGIWKFSVEHFTTYGLEYDEDDEPEQPEHSASHYIAPEQDGSPVTGLSPEANGNFDYRWNKRRALPGAFDLASNELVGSDGDAGAAVAHPPQRQPFLGGCFVGSVPNALILSTEDEPVADRGEGYGLSGETDLSDGLGTVQEIPGGILRARMRALKGSSTPVKLQVTGGDEWMNMLQRSVSPQKRDRTFLRSTNASASRPAFEGINVSQGGCVTSDAGGFATSIDLMNSLFEKAKAPAPQAASRGFVQWPYERQTKSFGDQSGMSEADRSFYNSMKPSWGPGGTLVFATTRAQFKKVSTQAKADSLMITKNVIQAQNREIQAAKFSSEASAKTLQNQLRMTKVELRRGVPEPVLHVHTIKSLFHDQDTNSPASHHEKLVWELASILFDEIDGVDEGSEIATRKTMLSRFWALLVDSSSSRSVSLAKSVEEKAIAALSGHRIPDACKYLLEGKNFRLATLISLIGISDQTKKDIRGQLVEWQEAKILSEFADPMRAIYELLSGNTSMCEGQTDVPLEDRMESFSISRRFGLDWKQAFGLRLWYSLSPSDNLSAAIRAFERDVAQGKEQQPQAWYLEQGIPALWEDQDSETRVDLLWGLMKLYAIETTDLEAVLRPENSQLSPLDVRLCWQLSRALMSTRKVSYLLDAPEKADALTIAFGDQLINEGSWLEATFVLLHLNHPDRRAKAVQDNLSRHAGLLGPESGESYTILTQTLKIPPSWIWEAQALFMRAVKSDAATEVQCLLRAGSFTEAHGVFVNKVAPSAVVRRDYAELGIILSRFEGQEDAMPGWSLGGEVIAISEMASMVATTIMELSGGEHLQDTTRVLGLPLAEDGHLRHSLHLSLSYYKGLMADAR
ncbi:Nucleoporin NUP145 [Colletotrichum orbiculare MAFF 240422]|uniref:Nucleoporin NUP145 n=1 Tax=Colletotrichum orbiculare (strain 104-T / ATCC 96160 / CBS 514.97 / LARS 414 / MAFF 240422) TaxID=1213857 RepID=A0A484G5S0_COLOR|nr:Nucleoporin NUP145 [Colletotrichum orbiculare MAFF 240422]